MTKTARFSELVERCGAPSQYLPWVAPKRDSLFQKALQEQRVVTVVQAVGVSKKDYGVVGLTSARSVAYFVFPRSLKRYADCRIIGIKYDLLTAATRPGSTTRVKPSKARARVGTVRAKKQFQVMMTCTSTVEVTETVEAGDSRAAAEIARQRLERKSINFRAGEISTRITGVKSAR